MIQNTQVADSIMEHMQAELADDHDGKLSQK